MQGTSNLPRALGLLCSLDERGEYELKAEMRQMRKQKVHALFFLNWLDLDLIARM